MIDRPFTLAEAWRSGLTHDRLRRTDLIAPFRGVRAPSGSGTEPLDQIALFGLALPRGHYFSHLSALRLHGLWIPARFEQDATVHVTAPTLSARRKGPGVMGHAIVPGADRVVDVAGTRVQSAADAWASMVGLLGAKASVMLGDSLVRRQSPCCSLDDLEHAVRRRRGRRYCRVLASHLSQIRPGTDSVKETELRLLIVSWGLPEPAVNRAIDDAQGNLIGIGDLVYERERIVLEYDGDHHRTDVAQFDHDIIRTDRLIQEGWRVIRVTARHLKGDAAELRARLTRALGENRCIESA